MEEAPRVYEVLIGGCATAEEAIVLQEPVARLLCPEEEHQGPCEVPWSLALADGRRDGESTVLVLGVYTTGGRAAEVAERVRAAVGKAHPTVLAEGDPGKFAELAEQYRVENESGRP